MIKIAAVVAVFFWISSSHAVNAKSCETAKSIVERADDEVCDYFVEAAESCFAKVNERYELLVARPAKTSAKDILTEAEPIKEAYQSAIAIVRSYLARVEMKPDVCGDQRVKVEVMIDELRSDLKGVSQMISRAKSR